MPCEILPMLTNPILNTDSYKASHWVQYPPNTTALHSYIESRGGRYPTVTFFGLQAILMDYLSQPITLQHVEEAAEFFKAHGEPFNADGWSYIAATYGHFPVAIRALPEGLVVPVRTPLVTVDSTDSRVPWVASYVETMLMRLWYPTTVSTVSHHVKQSIRRFLDETSDDPAGQVLFKLHDFGARGVSSFESAALGGMAHLVNFRGSDTITGVLAARRYYDEPMAAFSIPAAEHSTITAWGRENEVKAYENMLKQYGKPGAIFACVSDSYDVFHAISNLWGGELRQKVIDSGATLVVRPDSGDPVKVVLECAGRLNEAFGSTVNGKGFRVLKNVRLIQGDGCTPDTIEDIMAALKDAGYSMDNIAFGMGGGLLQKLDRDTMKFAMKCSAACVEGKWIDVFKDPVTDPGKASKKGRLTVIHNARTHSYETVRLDEPRSGNGSGHDALVHVFENGEILKHYTFAEVRANSESSP
jgi:nicotinamide phosphoribosyltransferase